jgi:hypothetical protein
MVRNRLMLQRYHDADWASTSGAVLRLGSVPFATVAAQGMRVFHLAWYGDRPDLVSRVRKDLAAKVTRQASVCMLALL